MADPGAPRRRLGRRAFAATAAGALLAPAFVRSAATAKPSPPPVIRTITAFVPMRSADDHRSLEAAHAFLGHARTRFEDAGAAVQTIRVAMPHLPRWHRGWTGDAGLSALEALDRAAGHLGVSVALGSLIEQDSEEPGLPDALAALFRSTTRLNAAISVADPGGSIKPKAIRTAARTIAALSRIDPTGAGNFRFAATARCNAGIPFFPAGWHDGAAPAFAIGLESPPLIAALLEPGEEREHARQRLVAALGAAFAPLDAIGHELASGGDFRWLGIDSSPAPGLKASIGGLIETISGETFGSMGTLAACGFLTGILKALPVKLTGYSGLMLPTLEDPVLARRAAEGRFGLSQLLLYSSVCGTGLDVAALPGDTTIDALSRIIGDVATLATRLDKPLLARLLPIPGKRAGEDVDFDHPLLTASRVMAA